MLHPRTQDTSVSVTFGSIVGVVLVMAIRLGSPVGRTLSNYNILVRWLWKGSGCTPHTHSSTYLSPPFWLLYLSLLISTVYPHSASGVDRALFLPGVANVRRALLGRGEQGEKHSLQPYDTSASQSQRTNLRHLYSHTLLQ